MQAQTIIQYPDMMGHEGNEIIYYIWRMRKDHWANYWSDKTDGEHRYRSEDFLESESKEKLLLLDGGDSILDFGCGSAELLAYYTPHYERCVGADFSESMIKTAKKRMDQCKVGKNMVLLHTDDLTIWEQIRQIFGADCKFDRITAGQVIQYMEKRSVDLFIRHALDFLSANGKICLFDIVDARTYELWEAGLFEREKPTLFLFLKTIAKRAKCIIRRLSGKPPYIIGTLYPPHFFRKIAVGYGLRISVINAMFYEYRYHVILEKQKTSP